MYKLRKAPKRNLYWVVTPDGKHLSKLPLPRKRAIAQMRAVMISEGLIGGFTPEQQKTYDSLMASMPTKEQYEARKRSTKSYEEFKKEREEITRERVLNMGKKEGKARCPDDKKYDPSKEYNLDDHICKENPDGSTTYDTVRNILGVDPIKECKVNGKFVGNMAESECEKYRQEAWEKHLENEAPDRKVFRKINQGLTDVADFVVENAAKALPGVGKFVASAYKQFAPPTSKYYEKDKSLVDRVVDTATGVGGSKNKKCRIYK